MLSEYFEKSAVYNKAARGFSSELFGLNKLALSTFFVSRLDSQKTESQKVQF